MAIESLHGIASRVLPFLTFIATAAVFLWGPAASAAAPAVGPNVNMVTGTRWPEGDPFLTKQNEVSLAVSSRNPRHLLGGSNDYRLIPVEIAEQLDEPEAWLTLYKSLDGGTTWRSVLLGGCPLNIPQCADDPAKGGTGQSAPLKPFSPNFGADPTVRAGPHGTFFVSFIAGTRDTGANGVVGIQRFVDKNNEIQRDFDVRQVGQQTVLKPAEDPIVPDVMNIIDTGVQGQFVDKPWNAADVGGRSWNAGKTCDLLTWTASAGQPVKDVHERVPAFSVYVSYANFAGQGQNQHPVTFVAASSDCGQTFGKPLKVSNSLQASQGTSLAIDPLDGSVYVAWRVFADSTSTPPKPDAIYVSKSSDGGKTWLNQPVLVATINAYDQNAAGGAFRTLGFPTIAVTVKGQTSYVHVAWTQRKAPPSATPPFACTSANAADCDARIVIATSTDHGTTWSAAKQVDSAYDVTLNGANPAWATHSRGHQVQPALTFAAGKLLITWLDQRFDHSEEVLSCPTGAASCTSSREAKGNLVNNCSVDISQITFDPRVPPSYQDALAACKGPGMATSADAVWTTYITDGTPGLVRRHTLDVFAAMADPDDVVAWSGAAAATPFQSNRVSQYTFGSVAQSTKDVRPLRQLEFNPPNLPMFANGTVAFLGDYIDANSQTIVPSGDVSQPYKFNVGCSGAACGQFTTGGLRPVFHVGFTDNRMVLPPADGIWSAPTCLTTAFTTDGSGNVNGVNNFSPDRLSCSFGKAGNRNQNVFSTIVSEHSVAYANTNSKLLNTSLPRGFVVSVDNYTDFPRSYTLTINAPSSVLVSFDKDSFPAQTSAPTLQVDVQPHSSATRTIWAKAVSNADLKTRIVVDVASGSEPSTQVVLNGDPLATDSFVGNGDLTGLDVANNDLGNVVLSNAVLNNNALTNATLDDKSLINNVLSNNALTNAALSNVVLSNSVLSNLQVENLTPQSAALTNNALTNSVLSNVMLTNVVLTNQAVISAALNNAVLSNNALTNVALNNTTIQDITNQTTDANALTNVALTNIDPANVALSNAVLSNNALTNVVLSNNALSNAVLSNNALTNAALNNVVLSNNALSNAMLSNAVLSNNVLSNAALSNAPLSDLQAAEQANPDLTNNTFNNDDLASSTFADATFAVRNRGNTDTTLAIKLILRDAICPTDPNQACALPAGSKLQLVLRKVAFSPTAIPATSNATQFQTNGVPGTERALRVGLTQSNAQVANVGAPVLVNPADPNLGKYIPTDRGAATLPLAPGERAYVTLRAIGTGANPADLVKLLRWGAKIVALDASANPGTRNPLIIQTLALPAVTAAQQANLTLKTFGGLGKLSGSVACVNSDGGTEGNPPCLPSPTIGTFAADGTATLSFTPNAAGTFYLLVTVTDSSTPPQNDRQLLQVVVNAAGTSTALTSSSPNPSVYGQTVALTATVSVNPPNTGSPGGTVTFYDGASSLGTAAVGAGGVASFSTSNLAVGTHGVTATYGGDGSFTASTSAALSRVVNKAGTTTTLGISPSSPVFGQAVTLTATVAAVAPGSGSPTGTVTFTDGATVLATAVPLNGNTATTSVSLLSVGTTPHSITASYNGDGNFNTSSSSATNVTVGKAATTTALTPPSTTASIGSTVALTAKVAVTSPGAGAITGSVTFNGTPGGNVPVGLDASGSATYSSNTFPIGTTSLTASYAGDGNLVSSTSSAATVTIQKATTTTTLSANLTTAVFGTPVQLTASVAGSSPTGTVSFTDGTTTLGSSTLANGAAAFTANYLAVGDHALTASYGGDGTNGASSGNVNVHIDTPFSTTGPMTQARTYHTATLLADGRVLIAGGFDATGAATSTSEVYCPAVSPKCPAANVGKFIPVGNLPSKSAAHTATLLPTGKVLAVGGGNSSAELFDPNTGQWSPAGGVSVRSYHSATTLVDATGKVVKVLIAGGVDNAGKTLQTSQIIDAVTGAVTNGPTLTTPRERHVAIRLASGKVLIAGGRQKSGSTYVVLKTYELCDATTCTGSGQQLNMARFASAASMLPDGKVLVAGGDTSAGGTSSTVSAELFDPATGAWSSVTGSLGTPRREHTLTRLFNDSFLVTGGVSASDPLKSTEIYTSAFAAAPDMITARSGHRATRMADGRVLITGGKSGSGAAAKATSLAELFAGPVYTGQPPTPPEP